MNATPLSLYIHFPWCVRKCPYCDFNSHELGGEVPARQYVDALLQDFNSQIDNQEQRPLVSVFMGGGTPSLFPPDALARLLETIGRRLDLASAEITLEANPGTFDQAHFDGYREAGINRLSIGVQSFSDASLKAVGRIHSGNEAQRAYEGARQAGFDRINLDLMYALPGQSMGAALEDLRTAVSLAPTHLSWYQLTIEPNTYFYRYPPKLPDGDDASRISEAGQRLLVDAGYERYEISAYARETDQSQHNLNYWEFGDYIGIGAGAHGKLTTPEGIRRTTKSRAPGDYLAAPEKTRSDLVSPDDLVLEFLMNALRLTRGFRLQTFEQRTGLDRKALDDFIQKATAKGLLSCDGDQVMPTEKGTEFLNDLLLLL